MAIEFIRLGFNPESESIVSKALYSSEAVDEAVVLEFGTTVDAYRDLYLDEIAKRLNTKYGGNAPQAVGFIATMGGSPVGMSFAGPKSYLAPTEEIHGVNVSGWVSAQTRGQGIGTELMRHGVSASKDIWDLSIWTSIHFENIASQKMCQRVGFIQSHPQLEDGMTDRTIYILKS